MTETQSLAQILGYEYRNPKWWQRLIAILMSTRLMSWIGRWTVPFLDRRARSQRTPGKAATFRFTGIPPLVLRTVGHRSGLIRSTSLFGIPIDGDLGLIGTAFGKPSVPTWVKNLLSNPSAEVEFGDRSARVVVREATSDEAKRIWTTAQEIYPGFSKYQKRITNREVKVFVVTPQ